MEDLLFAILYAVGELILEAFGELLVEACVVFISRTISTLLPDTKTVHPFLAAIGYLLLGGLLGIVSVLIYPHWLFHPSRFRGISLLVSPLLTGLVMWQVGSLLRRKDKRAVPLESFGYGFIFALGWAVVRFIGVKL